MFKNFDKVFKFTFHNQVSEKGYKMLTFIMGFLLLVTPVVIFLIMGSTSKKTESGKLESCGADKIYVVNEAAEVSDYSMLKAIGGDGYANIEYVPAKTVDEALDTAKNAGEKTSFVLHVTKNEDETVSAEIILPETCGIESKKAKNYYEAMSRQEMMFVITIRGLSLKDMAEVGKTIDTDGFDVSGWKSGTSLFADKAKADEQNNEKIRDVFAVIITMLVCVIMYMVVIAYGVSISKNVVMEKSSKLMDTLLISVKPEALVFGKLTGVLAAGLLQFLFWIAMLVGGVLLGVKLTETIFPGVQVPAITFIKSFGSMNMFRPVPVLLAVIVLLFGIIMYCAMAAFAGAISSTQEQAASNQGIFMMILVISYFLVLSKGTDIVAAPIWLFLVPFTAALILPTGLMLGTLSMSTALIGVGILVLLTLVLLIIAGRTYKAMALYKGNDGGIKNAIKVLTNK